MVDLWPLYNVFGCTLDASVKGCLYPSKDENKLDKDLYCTLHKFVLLRFIQINQGHRDSAMHEISSSVNKVNKAVAKARTIGDRLPLKGAINVLRNYFVGLEISYTILPEDYSEIFNIL